LKAVRNEQVTQKARHRSTIAHPAKPRENNNVKIAILDDYQQVAMQSADWSSLPAGTEVKSFAENIADQDELVRWCGFLGNP